MARVRAGEQYTVTVTVVDDHDYGNVILDMYGMRVTVNGLVLDKHVGAVGAVVPPPGPVSASDLAPDTTDRPGSAATPTPDAPGGLGA